MNFLSWTNLIAFVIVVILLFLHNPIAFHIVTWAIVSVYAIVIAIRYVVDFFKIKEDVKSLVSVEDETYFDYKKEINDGFAGMTTSFVIILSILNIFLHLPIISLCKLILIFLLMDVFYDLPYSKSGYKKWVDNASVRKKQRLARVSYARTEAKIKTQERERKEQERERKLQDEKRKNELVLQFKKELNNYDYSVAKLQEVGFTQSKRLSISGGDYLVIDNESKKFAVIHYKYNCRLPNNPKINEEKFLRGKSLSELETLDIRKDVAPLFCDYKQKSAIYSYSDLIRVEVADKSTTDTKRTFVIDGKSDDALWGSLIGGAFFGEVGATVGAVTGAAGGRNVYENVETTKTTAFDVTLYLNDFDKPNITLRVKYEDTLRNLVGALEYILNNKNS